MQATTEVPPPRNYRSNRCFSLLMLLLTGPVLIPYVLLILISLGSGLSFPRLLPDRIDFSAWRHFFADRDSMLNAIATSAFMSITVGTLSTAGGLLIGRTIRRSSSKIPQFVAYLPFVVSPVIVGIGLYDLMIRLGLAGTMTGVILLQTIFALAFSSVFFSELWSSRSERLELLVANLGGNHWAVWRHAIFPQSSGLIVISFLQTSLYSWLDYGIVSTIGAGTVPSLTTKLFSYIREASINQAAQSSLILLAPALIGFLFTALAYRFQNVREESDRRSRK